MKLIKEAKKLYKLWSVRLAALIPILAVLAEVLPELKVLLPEGWYAAIALAVIVARAIKQKGIDEHVKSDETKPL